MGCPLRGTPFFARVSCSERAYPAYRPFPVVACLVCLPCPGRVEALLDGREGFGGLRLGPRCALLKGSTRQHPFGVFNVVTCSSVFLPTTRTVRGDGGVVNSAPSMLRYRHTTPWLGLCAPVGG